jgi:hypothetical protein
MKTMIAGLALVLTLGLAAAEPTESREWVSVTGSKVKGSALSVSAGQVLIKLENGRELTVPLNKLSESDQGFLSKHFGDPPAAEGAAAAKTTGSGLPLVTDGLAHKVGEVAGPIDAGGGSHYFVYVPKTLRKGRLAPLLHFNGSGGGSARSVKKHAEGAELNGWIVAASVESKNGPGHPVQNHEHAKNCVKHLIGSLPVDPQRVYFTGGSGGGAMSFYNAARIQSAGAMPHIGYIPDDTNLKGGDFFVINGANDYNRYTSAAAVKSLGKNAIHRFFVGGHQEGPDWLCAEGMTWLNGRYLAKNKRSPELAAERPDYEAAMISWIEKLSSSEPHRAYYWCVFLKDDYKITGPNAAAVESLRTSLAGKPGCEGYAKGIAEISDFSERNYAEMGSGSLFAHTTPKLESAAAKLAGKLAGVPLLEELATALGKPTVGK